MNPDTRPMGPRTTRPTTKYNILADLFAIHNYPLSMYEEENSRLKRLTIATAIAYVISWISGALATRLLYNEQYLWFTVNNLWIALLTVFIGAIWMPLAIFLFVQARKLGFGIEVDFRSYGEKLLISHDPILNKWRGLTLVSEFEFSDLAVAINIKEDGLGNQIHNYLKM